MPTRNIPDLLLERVAAGELSLAEVARRRGASELEVAARVAEFSRSSAEILRAYPPAEVAAAVRARLGPRPRARRQRRFVMSAIAASCALLLLARLWPEGSERVPRPAGAPTASGTRSKGAPALLVYRKTASGTERLRADTPARHGDLLQLGYVPAGRAYGVLFSLDGRGRVSLHFPSSPGESTALRPDATVLPYSFRLDDAPEFERFIFVTSSRPIDVSALLEKAGRLAPARSAPLLLPNGHQLSELLLLKPPHEVK